MNSFEDIYNETLDSRVTEYIIDLYDVEGAV